MKMPEVVIVLLIIAVLFGGTVGWVKNVIKLTDTNFEPPYKTEAIRIVGLIPPVGAIVGWMDFDDKSDKDGKVKLSCNC